MYHLSISKIVILETMSALKLGPFEFLAASDRTIVRLLAFRNSKGLNKYVVISFLLYI